MLARIRKIWRVLGYFLHARKTWHWPRQSDVLIYDAEGHEILLEYLAPWKPVVLHVRGELINIPVLLVSFMSGRLSGAYLDSFIKAVRPRLIATFIDNDQRFYSIAPRHPSIKTLFIQNGLRSYHLDIFESMDLQTPSSYRFKVDYMMTFGQRIGAEYARYIRGNVVPMGSLRNNLVLRSCERERDTIAFISQYRKLQTIVMGKPFPREVFFEQPDKAVLSFLLQYAQKKDKKLFVITFARSGDALEEERRYYNALLGQTFTFSPGNSRDASYDAVDSAEVVVSIDSTLGYESAARGKKTAIFSIRTHLEENFRHLSYGWPEIYPDEGPFWTNRQDPSAFERILDHLFAIDDEQWQAELAEQGFHNIMVHDPGNTLLQAVLKKELGAPPSRSRLDQKNGSLAESVALPGSNL